MLVYLVTRFSILYILTDGNAQQTCVVKWAREKESVCVVSVCERELRGKANYTTSCLVNK